MDIGNLPLGEIFPVRISAKAVPPSCPGYHAITTPSTSLTQDVMSNPPPALRTTITVLLIFATYLISCSWYVGKLNGRSNPSPSMLLLNPVHITTLSALFSPFISFSLFSRDKWQ